MSLNGDNEKLKFDLGDWKKENEELNSKNSVLTAENERLRKELKNAKEATVLTESQSDSEGELLSEAGSQPNAEVEPQSGTDVVEPSVEVGTEPDTESVAEPQFEAESQPDTDGVAEPSVEASTQPDAESVAEPQFEAESQPDTESVAEPQFEAESQPDIDGVAEPSVEASTQPDAESAAEPSAEAGTQPDTESVAEPSVEASTQPDAESVAEASVEVEAHPAAEDVAEPPAEAGTQPNAETEPSPEKEARSNTSEPVQRRTVGSRPKTGANGPEKPKDIPDIETGEQKSRRSIRKVIDTETDEVIDADAFFQQENDTIQTATRFLEEAKATGQPKFVCFGCKQPVKISKRGNNYYFQHWTSNPDCEYTPQSSQSPSAGPEILIPSEPGEDRDEMLDKICRQIKIEVMCNLQRKESSFPVYSHICSIEERIYLLSLEMAIDS